MDDPVPINDPPQEPAYHFQVHPELGELGVTDKVELCPQEIDVGLAFAEIGDVHEPLTVTVVLTHAVGPHAPSARTKYVVVVVGFTDNDVPEPIDDPPQELAYHFQVHPEPGEAGNTDKVEV